MIDTLLFQLTRLIDKAVAITKKILVATIVFVLFFGVVGTYAFGFWELFAVLKYDSAMKAGKGTTALFWIQRAFSSRYYIVAPEDRYQLGKCYELAGEYEKALDQYRLYLYYEPHFSVRLDICRLYYKMGESAESFRMYRKLLDSMSNEEARFVNEHITGFSSIDKKLSPFNSMSNFQAFMDDEYEKSNTARNSK